MVPLSKLEFIFCPKLQFLPVSGFLLPSCCHQLFLSSEWSFCACSWAAASCEHCQWPWLILLMRGILVWETNNYEWTLVLVWFITILESTIHLPLPYIFSWCLSHVDELKLLDIVLYSPYSLVSLYLSIQAFTSDDKSSHAKDHILNAKVLHRVRS